MAEKENEMKLKVQERWAPFSSAGETYLFLRLVGVTPEQVDKLFKFVNSNRNEATLEDRWMFAVAPGIGSGSLKIIHIESAVSYGELFTVELKIPRYSVAYRNTETDDKDSGFVEIPIIVLVNDLHELLGWI